VRMRLNTGGLLRDPLVIFEHTPELKRYPARLSIR
jgi:hypothetical protein